MSDKLLGGTGQVLKKSPTKAVPKHLSVDPVNAQEMIRNRAKPLGAARLQDSLLPSGQPTAVWGRSRKPRQFALHADELGAVGIALFFEPVGVHQPRPVIVGILDDHLQERVVGGHGRTAAVFSEPGVSKP